MKLLSKRTVVASVLWLSVPLLALASDLLVWLLVLTLHKPSLPVTRSVVRTNYSGSIVPDVC